MKFNSIPSYETIHIHFVLNELVHLQDQPELVASILDEADIDPHLLTTPNARVTSKQFLTLFVRVAHILGDELAGYGPRKLPVGYFKTLCRFSIHGKSLLSCLSRSATFSDLFQEITGYHVSIDSNDDTTSVVATPMSPSNACAAIIERSFMNTYKFFVWLAGRHIQLVEARFSFPAPEYMEEYRQIFYCPLEFNCQLDELVFRTKDLHRAPVRNELDASELLESAPVSLWVKGAQTLSYTAMVRNVLAESKEGDALDQDTIAAKLQISPITLRRRLAKEGSSFQSIKDHFRRDRAISLLLDKSRAITDIAFELGYSDPSAFFRAFKHWMGLTPSEYRHQSS